MHVCTNTACKKTGSVTVYEMFRDLAGESVKAEQCGCLGECGAGPNTRVSPSGALYRGIYKPAQAAKVFAQEFGVTVLPSVIAAYKEKMYGDQELADKRYSQALARYESALASGELQLLPAAMCSVWLSKAEALHKLATDDRAGLDAAEAAVRTALSYSSNRRATWLRLCDVLESQGRIQEALNTVADMKKAVSVSDARGLNMKTQRLQSLLAA